MPLKRMILIIMAFALIGAQPVLSQSKYPLQINFVDKDSTVNPQSLGLQTAFSDKTECEQYTEKIPSLLQAKGYITASVDSSFYDSSFASIWIYLGAAYRWVKLDVSEADQQLMNEIGWDQRKLPGQNLDFQKLNSWQEKALNYLENHGYPFAKVRLDSLQIENDEVSAILKVDRGPLYKIDSITVRGDVKISNNFLQKYLGIEKGSIYKKDKLMMVSPRLLELPYLTETRSWELTQLGTGSTLNLYLKPKKSSQIDVLVGFLPDNTQKEGKLLITGQANINLKNALGGGETIGARWEQLQIKSPRLNLVFSQPYIFKTSLGFDFNFDLLKKDSSYITLNTQVGLLYMVSARQSGKIFFQSFVTNLLDVDTAYIKATKQLPQYLDVSTTNLGVDYLFNNTDYRYNPRRGNDINVVVSGGLRKIKENTTITSLSKDAGFDYASLYDTLKTSTYLVRAKLSAAHYFRIAKRATIKTAVNGGLIQTENPFKNEVFQIGGYRLLRGFDEESIFATQYLVFTAEYRYLIGLNSYLFAFTDGGWARNDTYTENQSHSYLGVGLGLAFETKAGIFNISYAVGKTNETTLNFSQSKIHFGFVSLF
jgi:outer membrane protein assembly factor BamA